MADTKEGMSSYWTICTFLNMIAIVFAATFFASAWLNKSVQRGIHMRNITRISKRLFGVPDFHYYVLADGIASLVRRYGK